MNRIRIEIAARWFCAKIHWNQFCHRAKMAWRVLFPQHNL